MTVSSTTTSVSYTGNGSTTEFAVTFPFYEIEVAEIASGVVTVKTEGTHYTVAGGDGSTGTVTMLVAPASGVTLLIRRTTAKTQLIDYVEAEAFPAAVAEEGLDRAAMIAQEMGQHVRYTPTLGALSGSLGSGNAVYGSYSRIGDTVFYRIAIVIADLGTATGYLTVTLPATPYAVCIGHGRNVNDPFNEIMAQHLSSTTLAVFNPEDSGLPGGVGDEIIVQGHFLT